MRKYRIIGLVGAMILIISATSIFVFAASYNSPAEVAAAVTGKSVDEVIAERMETKKTYGTIAKESDALEEFKNEILLMKKAILEEKVKDGTITREKADEVIRVIESNQVNCDGSGSGVCCGNIGEKQGIGFGRMHGNKQGLGQGGNGFGHHRGSNGFGKGLRNQ